MYSGTTFFSLNKIVLLWSHRQKDRYPAAHRTILTLHLTRTRCPCFPLSSCTQPKHLCLALKALCDLTPPTSPATPLHLSMAPRWSPFGELSLCFPASLIWFILFHLTIISFTSFSADGNPTYLLRSSVNSSGKLSLKPWYVNDWYSAWARVDAQEMCVSIHFADCCPFPRNYSSHFPLYPCCNFFVLRSKKPFIMEVYDGAQESDSSGVTTSYVTLSHFNPETQFSHLSNRNANTCFTALLDGW